jgi:hypothetical protein
MLLCATPAPLLGPLCALCTHTPPILIGRQCFLKSASAPVSAVRCDISCLRVAYRLTCTYLHAPLRYAHVCLFAARRHRQLLKVTLSACPNAETGRGGGSGSQRQVRQRAQAPDPVVNMCELERGPTSVRLKLHPDSSSCSVRDVWYSSEHG